MPKAKSFLQFCHQLFVCVWSIIMILFASRGKKAWKKKYRAEERVINRISLIFYVISRSFESLLSSSFHILLKSFQNILSINDNIIFSFTIYSLPIFRTYDFINFVFGFFVLCIVSSLENTNDFSKKTKADFSTLTRRQIKGRWKQIKELYHLDDALFKCFSKTICRIVLNCAKKTFASISLRKQTGGNHR